MGFIVLTHISFTTPPTVVQIGDIFYKLASDPDVPGSYTEAFSNVSFNTDGTIVGGPRTITGLANGTAYTVKVQLDCGAGYWTKNITIPAATTTTTTTTSTSTTSPIVNVLINVCGDVVGPNRVLTFTASQPVNTDVQVFFNIRDTLGDIKETATTFIFNGTSSRTTTNGYSYDIGTVEILSFAPATHLNYVYSFGSFTGSCL